MYVAGCTMLAYGGRDTYGRVIGWNEKFGQGSNTLVGFEVETVLGDALPLANGLLVLEAQTKLVR